MGGLQTGYVGQIHYKAPEKDHFPTHRKISLSGIID